MNWISYNELAWTEAILAPPEEYKDEAQTYMEAVKKKARRKLYSMLHLGCGAGGHDQHFKNHYMVTGVDISEGMLHEAKKRNQSVNYISGDMRTIDLKQQFDVIMIPDSVMHLTTPGDVKMTVRNAGRHLHKDGVFLFVTHTKEEFKENNFVYSGSDEDTHITLFENNFLTGEHTYEAAMVYLIRKNEKLNIYKDVYTLGLFSEKMWMDVLEAEGFETTVFSMNELYNEHLMGEGEYKLKVFVSRFRG